LKESPNDICEFLGVVEVDSVSALESYIPGTVPDEVSGGQYGIGASL
jgi:hypothetical protein